jgi:hypothetical protein
MRRADRQLFDVLFTSTYPRRSERQDRVFLGIIDITARARQNQKLARLEADLAHAARVATLGELRSPTRSTSRWQPSSPTAVRRSAG